MKDDGPLDWLKELLLRPEPRSHIAAYIAIGALGLVPILSEVVGIVPVGGPAPWWIGPLAAALAFALAMRYLPEK